MQIDFKFEGEIAVTPAIAGDLWAELVAMSDDAASFAEDGEAFFTVACRFEGDQDDDLLMFETSRLTVDDKPCPEHLVTFFDNQLCQQRRDEIDQFILNWGEYRHWPLARALADVAGFVRRCRDIEAKRRASINTMGVL